MTRAMFAFALLILVVLAISFVAERAASPEPMLLIDAQAKGCSPGPPIPLPRQFPHTPRGVQARTVA